MNENLKKGLLIGVIVIAVIIGAWQVQRTISAETPHVEAKAMVEPGHKSEKELALEAQQKAAGNAAQPGKPANDAASEAAKDAALAGG